MSDAQPALPDIGAWQAGQIELVTFPVDWQPAAEQDWCHELTGAEVESTRKKNERVDTALIHGATLRFAVTPVRLSWSLIPNLEATVEDGVAGPPTVGRLVDALGWFVPLMQAWIRDSCPPVSRLAFTAVGLQFNDTREANYRLLNSYLHHVSVDPQSQELLYRINRPRQSRSGIQNLELNRLSTWSSLLLATQMKMQVGGLPTPANPQRVVSQNFQACMLQLDINSSQEFAGALPRDRMEALWTELVDLGREIAEHGDIR